MNKKIKAKWVKALRSGRYKQGHRRLRKPDLNGKPLYCCLGVLCSTMNCRWKVDAYGYSYGSGKFKGCDVGLSDEIKKETGITEKQQNRLIDLNDYKNKSFNEISDYIERYL